MQKPVIVWFRKDLRLRDNPALSYAAKTKKPIIPLYIFSEKEHHPWEMGEASSWWLHYSLLSLNSHLKLVIRKGSPLKVIQKLFEETGAGEIVFNHCYEPFVEDSLVLEKFPAKSFHGSVLFPPGTIKTLDGHPFKVFTPFWNACLKEEVSKPLPLPRDLAVFSKKIESLHVDDLKLLSKEKSFDEWTPGEEQALLALKSFVKTRARRYQKDRDFPALPGGSFLSPHLHFGEISPKQVWEGAQGHLPFLRQIVWREFAIHLLMAFPHIPTTPFNPKFKKFPWKKNAKFLEAWQEGKTGYPIVDAGMRQLSRIGWMHNRLRMIVGSFLVKDLNISWTEGSLWFWHTLVDADLANNTFGWQWVSGCGTDAAPYFRIFNPVLQGEKFDPDGEYVKRFVPELASLNKKWIHKPWLAPQDILLEAGIVLGKDYPFPIVNHEEARKEALQRLEVVKE